MSAETDLIKLYSGRILELAADMPAPEPLDDPQAVVKKRSPLCGSTVTVSLSLPADAFEPAVIGKSAELGWMASLPAEPPKAPGTYLPGATYALDHAA